MYYQHLNSQKENTHTKNQTNKQTNKQANKTLNTENLNCSHDDHISTFVYQCPTMSVFLNGALIF